MAMATWKPVGCGAVMTDEGSDGNTPKETFWKLRKKTPEEYVIERCISMYVIVRTDRMVQETKCKRSKVCSRDVMQEGHGMCNSRRKCEHV